MIAPSTATSSPEWGLTASRVAALAGWLSAVLGGEVSVNAVQPAGGSATDQIWRIDASIASGPRSGQHAWSLQTGRASDRPLGIDRETEAAVVLAAAASGVPVAVPLAQCADDSVIGQPFLIQPLIAGVRAGAATQQPAEPDDALAREIGRALAGIHRVVPGSGTIPALPIPMLPPARTELARLRSALAQASQARPALEYCLAWLDANAPPPPASLTLVHGAFQAGNLLVDAGRITAVTGWQHAHWGDPAADIGTFCARCFRTGDEDAAREAGGIGSRLALIEGYGEVAARPIDQAGIAYWEVMAAARAAVGAVLDADRFLSGGDGAMELALTALTVPEYEFDALAGIATTSRPRQPA